MLSHAARFTSKGMVIVAMTMLVASMTAASQTVMPAAVKAGPQPKDYGGILHATTPRPSFEVASIRPSPPNAASRFTGITMRPNAIEVRGSSIKEIIEFAYAVPNESEFSGGPGWIRTDKFDITAKPSEAAAGALRNLSSDDLHTQMRLMLQSMLEQRLQLKVSFPKKVLPVFNLVVAKGGFKCRSAAPHAQSGPPPPPPPDNLPPPPGRELWREQEMHWTAHQLPFALIVAWIAKQPDLGGRTVVDKTGRNGLFDCEISWAHEGSDVPGPAFFTAIQEQMGLKLQPEHGPVETIVVDKIDHPSEN